MTIKSIDYGLIIDSNTYKCWLLNTQFYTILHNSTQFYTILRSGVMVVLCGVRWCYGGVM